MKRVGSEGICETGDVDACSQQFVASVTSQEEWIRQSGRRDGRLRGRRVHGEANRFVLRGQ